MRELKLNKFLRYFISSILLVLPFTVAIDIGDHQMELPTEPLLLIIGIIGLYFAYRERAWEMPFFRHPLFLVALAYMIWSLTCTVFANHFFISAKYSLVALAHWWVYFCLWGLVFKSNKDRCKPWLFYGLSFAIVLFYAWIQHSQYNFRVDASVLVARPFYFDHALYSCAALLLLGFTLPYWWKKSNQSWSWVFKFLSIVFLIGVYLSFSRAAWLSLFGAMALSITINFLQLNFKQFLISCALLIALIAIALMMILPNKNSQVLSKQGDSWQHLRSTLNISTDVSNLERINRYSCAWRMFKTKPIFGYGPGNFIIDYYPFQRPEEMTRLSVSDHQKHHRAGKGGGTHSEYLQALSEKGLIGLLLLLALILISIQTSIRILQKPNHTTFYKKIAIGILFSLLTFYIHGLFNNFFHQEKIAALVWSALAVLILIDIEAIITKEQKK